MLPSSSSGPRPKCYATHGTFLAEMNRSKYPKSKKPFSTILGSAWYHNVDLILPMELVILIQDSLDREAHHLKYSRVHMSLSDIITGDFFNIYIKTGTIELLSISSTSSNIYHLKNGVMTLDVPKEIFLRLGLPGKPIPSGGRKHVPTRMRVEINLRLPSMVSGRKGFERIKVAFRNVLNESVTWLFRDCKPDATQGRTIEKLHPLERGGSPPERIDLPDVLVPEMVMPAVSEEQKDSTRWLASDEAMDVMEWVSLVSVQSPRIRAEDSIDSYLCRQTTDSTGDSRSVTLLRWHGFIPSSWIIRLLTICNTYFQCKDEAWFGINASAIKLELGNGSSDGFCLLYAPRSKGNDTAEQGREFVLWEMVDCITPR